jgi:hypothetical protein
MRGGGVETGKRRDRKGERREVREGEDKPRQARTKPRRTKANSQINTTATTGTQTD